MTSEKKDIGVLHSTIGVILLILAFSVYPIAVATGYGILFFLLPLGLLPAAIARNRGYSFWLWWGYAVWLFPIALLHAFLVNPNQATLEARALKRDMKKCPFCAELIRQEAKVCRYCAKELPAHEPKST